MNNKKMWVTLARIQHAHVEAYINGKISLKCLNAVMSGDTVKVCDYVDEIVEALKEVELL